MKTKIKIKFYMNIFIGLMFLFFTKSAFCEDIEFTIFDNLPKWHMIMLGDGDTNLHGYNMKLAEAEGGIDVLKSATSATLLVVDSGSLMATYYINWLASFPKRARKEVQSNIRGALLNTARELNANLMNSKQGRVFIDKFGAIKAVEMDKHRYISTFETDNGFRFNLNKEDGGLFFHSKHGEENIYLYIEPDLI